MFSTSADAGEGSSTGATASGQQPVMFGGISSYHIIYHMAAYSKNRPAAYIFYIFIYICLLVLMMFSFASASFPHCGP